ncbi:MAG: TraR/DksA C4-type zinc finger protein [Candidatus Jorgensenbacteria bacterium]
MSPAKEELKKFEKKLNETKEEILADLEKLKEGLDFGNDTDSLEEEADETEEYSHYVGIKKPLEERLRAVEDSLLKIHEGAYGICEKCGGKIEPEILEIVPESRLCKHCKIAA